MHKVTLNSDRAAATLSTPTN